MNSVFVIKNTNGATNAPFRYRKRKNRKITASAIPSQLVTNRRLNRKPPTNPSVLCMKLSY